MAKASGQARVDRSKAVVLSDVFDLGRMRAAYDGAYIANDRYDLAMAIEARERDRADLISFARPCISNPDLVERFTRGAPLADADPSTFDGGDRHGDTDDPALAGVPEDPRQPGRQS